MKPKVQGFLACAPFPFPFPFPFPSPFPIRSGSHRIPPMSQPDPIEAMRRLASRLRARRSERTPIEQALGRRLAAPLELPARRSEEGLLRSTLNGYALGPGQGAGEYALSGVAAAAGNEEGPGGPGAPEELPRIERVDSGSVLPPGTERVVPVEWTVMVASTGGGPVRVRVSAEAIPQRGHGVAGPGEAAEVLETGTWIGPRLLALLLCREVAGVTTHVPLRIGILAIGGDLTDILEGATSGPGPARDSTGLWLPPLIRSLGHVPHPLGIAGDEPNEGRDALLRARRLGLDAVVTTGGLGDGLNDRTAELVLRTGGTIWLDGVALRPGRRCFSGETMELKVLGLGGQPLDAAAAFDIILRPALLSAHGAPDSTWDWSRSGFPASRITDLEEAAALQARGMPGAPVPWSALPVKRGENGDGYRAIARPAPGSAFLPWIPGQEGWAVVPPAVGGGDPREGRAYFQACEFAGQALTFPALPP
jgi:molybdopterin molybdotransferase